MAEQEAAGVQPVTGKVDQLGAIKTLVTGAKLHLFKSSFTPTPDSTEADFVAAECAFTGYVAVVITWSAVGLGVDDVARMVGSRSFFQATDAVSPDTVGGFWIESSAGPPGIVEWYAILATPVPIDVALRFIAVTPTVGSDGSVVADVES